MISTQVDACRKPAADPFGELQAQLRADFEEIERSMHRIEGSSTQTFTPKGAETTMLEMLEARELALEEARDDLLDLNEQTDEAAHFWSHLYACDSDEDEDDEDDEICSPEEAQLLLYLGHSLHDYMYDVEKHKQYLTEMSERFDAGMF